ncbi:MAG: peptidylprolyl isomerase [Gammaproteobacteria bacterium]|jgi:FKBP-type peptidyl-prolyl cis-trans isomerase FkpA|nr:peptidylprolyl isomerase [Gammaproteobacteria bacterium]
MNSAVGSPDNTSPLERRPTLLTVTGRAVNGLAVAALFTGAALANAQNAAASKPAQAAPATTAAAPAAGAPADKKPAAKAAAGAADTSPKSQGSYAIGVSVGENLRRAKVSPSGISVEQIAQGIRDSLAGKAQMSQEYQTKIMALIQGARTAAAEPNHAAAATFLAANGKKKDVITTASGLQYKVLSPGTGENPKPTDQVSVNYSGKLLDGTEFDASAKHGGPAKFPVNGVIPGWQEALVLMKPGAKYQLWIPPKLAYDLDSPPTIPPGSLLVFDVELVSILPPAAAAATPQGHPSIAPPPPK